jgi:hypothetical protein
MNQMRIGTSTKLALVGGLTLLAALLAGCAAEVGSPESESVATRTAALSAGTTLATGSACTVGGIACAAGDYCAQDATNGVCTTTGVCTVRPTMCPQFSIVGGVCGCDGKVYGNGCYAEEAGTTVAHDGPCTCDPESTSTSPATTCAKGYTCSTTVGANDVCGTTGTCKVPQSICAEVCELGHEQFCGCNGVTYDACNQCYAQQIAPVQIAYQGACK